MQASMSPYVETQIGMREKKEKKRLSERKTTRKNALHT